MVMDYLACGIDPDKTMIYAHSAVPAANQLMLPFLSLVSEAELARNPTVKAEMEASGHELTGLLLTYPVHQACDILFCKGNVVPVGRDQLPHIELTRTIARRFNNRYGKVFPEVEALLSETPLLPGLDGRKMSKSYGNAINISMTAEETAKRIKKSQTDSERMITFDPENRPGVSGLLSTAAICTGRSEVEIAEEIGMGGSGQLKKYLTEAVNEYFAPIRERRQRYENDLDYVKDVLHEGNRRANEIAEQTLAEVQDAWAWCTRPICWLELSIALGRALRRPPFLVPDLFAPPIVLPRQTGTGPPAVSCQRACSRSTPLNRTEGRNANQTQQGRLFHRLLPAPLLKPI